MPVNIIGNRGLKVENLYAFLAKFFNNLSHKFRFGVLAGEEFELGTGLVDEH